LIGSYLEATSGKKVADGVAYLNSVATISKAKCDAGTDPASLETMDRAWDCVAANCVKKAADDFTRFVKEGNNKEVAHELCSQERYIASKVRP
jgi:acyl-CoA oxidase